MKPLPKSDDTLVVRTDYSDDQAWEAVCAAIRRPVGQFRANVEYVSDPAYDGLAAERLLALIPPASNHAVIFVVDQTTLIHPERPVLVVDLEATPGRTFRVVPRQMWGVENNLSLANMDFEEFADAVDADGIFRDLPAE